VHELATLVAVWVRLLVNEPKHVRVGLQPGESERPGRIMITVAAQDRGQLFGKNDRTIAALRTVVKAVAQRRGLACLLEVVE
jgi:predicted RNA-binding protein YlqC (UPF0109 family)